MSRLVISLHPPQDFAEKPKGDALEKMKVDTTVLGMPHLQIWYNTMANVICLQMH